jgi:DNA-binding response OmpR family regulator
VEENHPEQAAEQKGKIMLVDDEMMHRKLIKTILGAKKFDYVEASSGNEALENFKREDFDLVLMDLNMPGLTGTEAIREIKKLEKGKETPIIMVTAQSNLQGLIEGIEFGAIEYIVKPFSHDELRAKVMAIYNFHKQRVELSGKQAELERLKLLQQTVVTLSHHINNALSSVSLFLQTVDPNDPEKVKELIKVVHGQSNKILAVIKGMEEMAKSSDIRLIDYPGATSEMLDITELMKKYIENK